MSKRVKWSPEVAKKMHKNYNDGPPGYGTLDAYRDNGYPEEWVWIDEDE